MAIAQPAVLSRVTFILLCKMLAAHLLVDLLGSFVGQRERHLSSRTSSPAGNVDRYNNSLKDEGPLPTVIKLSQLGTGLLWVVLLGLTGKQGKIPP